MGFRTLKKLFKAVVCLLTLLSLSSCNWQTKKEGEIDKNVYALASDFKDTYQKWVDMKSDGQIQYKEYAADLKAVGTKFKDLGKKAETKAIASLLENDDKKLYASYGDLGAKLVELSTDLSKNKQAEAKTLYQDILTQEEAIKE